MLGLRRHLTVKSFFHMALSLFQFDCEIALKSVPGTNLSNKQWLIVARSKVLNYIYFMIIDTCTF